MVDLKTSCLDATPKTVQTETVLVRKLRGVVRFRVAIEHNLLMTTAAGDYSWTIGNDTSTTRTVDSDTRTTTRTVSW